MFMKSFLSLSNYSKLPHSPQIISSSLLTTLQQRTQTRFVLLLPPTTTQGKVRLITTTTQQQRWNNREEEEEKSSRRRLLPYPEVFIPTKNPLKSLSSILALFLLKLRFDPSFTPKESDIISDIKLSAQIYISSI